MKSGSGGKDAVPAVSQLQHSCLFHLDRIECISRFDSICSLNLIIQVSHAKLDLDIYYPIHIHNTSPPSCS